MLALLPVHIAAGGLAILLGTFALIVRKGRTLHRKSGLLFVCAMLVMGVSGTLLALRHGLNANAIGGLLSAYLVLTSLTTVRPFTTGARLLAVGGCSLIIALAMLNLGLAAATFAVPGGLINGVPAPAFLVLALIAIVAAVGDVEVLRHGPRLGKPRLARHLWRMCLAFWIAVASFFSIRSRVARILPEPFLSPLMRTLPIVLVLVVMAYWMWRMRVGRTPRSVVPFTQERPALPIS